MAFMIMQSNLGACCKTDRPVTNRKQDAEGRLNEYDLHLCTWGTSPLRWQRQHVRRHTHSSTSHRRLQTWSECYDKNGWYRDATHSAIQSPSTRFSSVARAMRGNMTISVSYDLRQNKLAQTQNMWLLFGTAFVGMQARRLIMVKCSSVIWSKQRLVVFGGLVVSVLEIGSKVRVFKPGRGRRTFKGDKNPQHAFLRTGNTAVSPMS
jgi:hypothetical protein